jgi:hypothetical protein
MINQVRRHKQSSRMSNPFTPEEAWHTEGAVDATIPAGS